MNHGSYDFIHLNSLVLHSLISPDLRCIIHIRDVYDGSNPQAISNVQNACGVIFIDEATRAPFRNIPLRKSIVLNNPIDMSGVAAYTDHPPRHPLLDSTAHTIFSVIGVASEQKGTGFIVRAFLRHPDPHSRLLIVGGREPSSLAEYQTLARRDRRIVFWGEETDIDKIYAISDYILRGEPFPCIGRTIYEGLYAGCRVVVPGDPADPPPMFEQERYHSDIFFYRPRSESDLLSLLKRLSGKKVVHRAARSNVPEYVRAFHSFIISTIEDSR